MDGHALPEIIQSGQTGVWRFFAYPSGSSSEQFGIVVGPDKNMWIVDYDATLFRVTMKAKVKEFILPTVSVGGTQVILKPTSLAVGADGKFYMTTASTVGTSGVIAVATTTGSTVGYATPSNESVDSNGMVLGPDGNVWFPETSHIAHITPGGIISQIAYPTPNAGNGGAVTVGPDGDIWFTEPFNGRVGKILPGSNTITEYKIKDSSTGSCRLFGITNGGDGFLYALGGNCILADTYSLLRITTMGLASAFSLPIQPPTGLAQDILRGPDRNIWITNESSNSLIIFNVKKSTFSVINGPSPATCVVCIITSGPDGNVWQVGTAMGVSVYLRNVLTVTPTQLTFTATGQSSTLQSAETGNPPLTAKSSNTAVATVAPGQSFDSFVVTAVGIGKATVIVQDKKRNSFDVKVSVQ